jgi:RND family efflux transporter MFP subunit
MKLINQANHLVVLLLLISSYTLSYAHDGEDHSKENKTTAGVSDGAKYFSSEAVSDKYELLLRYEPIQPKEKVSLTLFISEYATNKPVSKAELKVTAQEDSKLTFKVTQTAEGQYLLETEFAEKKPYSLAVSVNGNLGADLILLSNIEVGKELAHTDEAVAKSPFANWQTWLIVAIALIVGIGAGVLLQKRNTKAGRNTITMLLLLINFTLAVLPANAQHNHAHGPNGEHLDTNPQNTNFSNSFVVPKETQFSESTKLFGTIIPSSNGQAVVTTPQNGKITALNVRVGQQVKAGQLLGTVEQNIDAGTQVNLSAEKNNLNAEYQAAKKSLERLKSIQDIAAKKDIDEAQARMDKAENNLKLFNSNSGKYITLTAPISGTVANFSLSIGATVSAGQTLFAITNLAHIYAEAQVFDKDGSKVIEGAKFTIECANDSHKTSEVKLLSLAQEINATNQSQRVLFELNNPDGDFKIGEFVNIHVFSAENSQQISLPNSAITEINGKPVVFVKDAAERYTISYVQLGDNNGTYTSILKGVNEGDRVVTNATYQLKMIYLNQ